MGKNDKTSVPFDKADEKVMDKPKRPKPPADSDDEPL
jgi:hypothetical protein